MDLLIIQIDLQRHLLKQKNVKMVAHLLYHRLVIDGHGHVVKTERLQRLHALPIKSQYVEHLMGRRYQVCQRERQHVIHEIGLDRKRAILNLHGTVDCDQKLCHVVLI